MQVIDPQGVAPSALTGKLTVEAPAYPPSWRREFPQVIVAHAADVASLAVLLAFIAFVSWVRLWRDPAFADWDVVSFFVPFYSYLGEHVRSLDVPGWTPNIFSGTPFAAEPESGWGYFPAMFIFAVFPPLIAYKVFVIFHLVLAAASSYLLARLIGIRALGSFAAASYFTFTHAVGILGCCTIFSELSLWIPPALVGVELTCRAQQWAPRLLSIALTGVAISQILSGWVGQGSYYGLLAVGSYFLFRTIILPPCPGRKMVARMVDLGLYGALSFGIGFGLGAVALLPRLDNVALTFVGSSSYLDLTCEPQCGQPWYAVLQTLMGFLSNWYPFYVGGAALACLSIGLLAVPRRRELCFFVGFGLVLLILSMEKTTLHTLFFALPEFEGLHLHSPQRILTLLPLPVAMLVGAAVDGFERIVRHKWALGYPIAARLIWWIAVLSVPVATLPIAQFTSRAYLLSCIVIFAGILLARTWTRQRLPWLVPAERLLPVLLVMLILWDPTGREVIEALRNPAKDDTARSIIEASAATTDPDGAGSFLKSKQETDELFRYYGYVAPPGPFWQAHEHVFQPDLLGLLHNNRALRLDLHDIQGYNPAQLDRYRLFFQSMNDFRRDYHEASVYSTGFGSPLIDLLNVRYIIVPNNNVTGHARDDLYRLSIQYDQVYMNDEVRVLENPNALPRAWMVHAVSKTSAPGARNLLASGKVDPREKALVEVDPPKVKKLPEGAEDLVTITGYDDDSIRVAAQAGADGFLVLSEIYNPGWKATIDGQPVKVYETDYLLRGVAVPKGSHEIVFTYQPDSLKYGLYLTLATTLAVGLIVLVAGVAWLRRGRKPAEM